MTKSIAHIFKKTQYVILLALFCTLLWGSAFPGVKMTYQYFQVASHEINKTMLLAGIRFALAGIVTLLVYFIFIKKVVLPKKSEIKGIVVTGIIQTGLQYLLFYIAISNLTGAKGAVLAATITFFSVFLSHIMFQNDKINGRKIVGCLIGFVGIIIINLKAGGNLGQFTFLGDGLMLLSVFLAALGAMISKVVSRKVNPVLLTGYQMTIGGTMLVVAGIVSGGVLTWGSVKGEVLLIYLVLVSAIGFSIWTTLMKYNKPSKIATFNFATPIFGAVLSAIFLKESIAGVQNFVALIFVCLGIYIVNKN